VTAADRYGHPANANGEWVTAERAQMKRFDNDAFIKAEMTQALGLTILERGPVDRLNGGARTHLELVERDRLRFEVRRHVAIDYQ
jgi:hypothetical protein